MITIFLADDHPFIRQGTRALVEQEHDLVVIGEVDDGLRAFDEIERLKPDVAVIDLVMPGLGGVEVIRRIADRRIPTHVVVLSLHSDDLYVSKALHAGAHAYVTKNSSPDILLVAIREVAAGRRYLCPSLAQRAVQAYFQKAQQTPSDSYENLTDRERDLLHLLVDGLTNVQIAERLSISVRTVELHRANMMRKLGLNNQVDLFRFALHRGIISVE